ncbi:PRC-barrel domain-containing protein [Sedimenticola hydrogenitrophicus]|uniref:PRC-barrel domain-containing protein n=1 Tax=Sedimenticola hydrogenitrophicus TaxID=2967975 RepID=UPI0021A80534|nr:PRC-barrel domain-containing protein [Sedimenticola hydrogenitrophicus]
MNKGYRKTLLAGAIAALIAGPVLGAEHAAQAPEAPGVTPDQPMQESPQSSPSTPQPMDKQTGTAEQPGAAEPSSMLALTPDDLRRQEVIGSDGEAIGRISDVVSNRGGGEIYAVISTGGFLGLIGGSEHVVPLSELRLEEQKLHLSTTQEELTSREEYTEDQYLVVQPDDRPISEFSAFEQQQPEQQPEQQQEQQPEQQQQQQQPAEQKSN